MLSDIALEYPVIQETFDEASEILGYDLWALTSAGPLEKLNQTECTQPALLTASVALWRLWLAENDQRPLWLAGHSLGEYSALVCAKALAFSDAVRLVALRGKLMQSAVPLGSGAMAAILGLTDAEVSALCVAASTPTEIVTPANYNSMGQVVIAGDKGAVARAIANAKAFGAKRAIELPVSVPSHCELMKPAALALEAALQSIRFELPEIPVIQNVDANIHPTIETIKQSLVSQLYCPVQWVNTIRYLVSNGVTTIVECGPGSVLSGLQKRIDVTLQCYSLSKREALCQ